MSSKIGLCICFYVKNYGSALQSFATIKFLEKNGIAYDLIRYQKKRSLKFFFHSVIKLFNTTFRNECIRLYKNKCVLNQNPDFQAKLNIRNEFFEKFEHENFKNKVLCTDYKELTEVGKHYDTYLVGSDQLWLPSGLSSNFFNLMFTADSTKRISYATSFGVSEIPYYQVRKTEKYLLRIQFLSVREQRGVEIVKKIANRKAELVLDPTLLLTKEDWLNLIPPKRVFNEPYIFAYLIGKNKTHRERILELGNSLGFKIVVLRHIDEYIPSDEEFGDYAPYDVGPEEFVNLIRNAEYVCTDSFHGTAFSILNEKQFCIFDRFNSASKQSTNSRIDSICSLLELQDRRVTETEYLLEKITNQIDYQKINRLLDRLRMQSSAFLLNSINAEVK